MAGFFFIGMWVADIQLFSFRQFSVLVGIVFAGFSVFECVQNSLGLPALLYFLRFSLLLSTPAFAGAITLSLFKKIRGLRKN